MLGKSVPFLVKGGDKNALIDAVRRAAKGCNMCTVEKIERLKDADAHFGEGDSTWNS
jgi:hypothetical protein